jgi:hypothetical protein
MIPKISLAAAFVLMMAPPMACASNHDVASCAPITRQANQSVPEIVLAQDSQDAPSMGTTDSDNDNSSDNDNDSNDSADDNQNGDSAQTDQNAAGDDQAIPPTVLGPDNDQSEPRQAPMNSYPQPVNPYQ